MGFYYLLHKDIPVAMFELDENDANAKPRRLSKNSKKTPSDKSHLWVVHSKNQILDEIEKDLETADTMPDDDIPIPDNISDIQKHKENHRNNNKSFTDDQLSR